MKAVHPCCIITMLKTFMALEFYMPRCLGLFSVNLKTPVALNSHYPVRTQQKLSPLIKKLTIKQLDSSVSL